jgi:hypothetical protein
LQTLYEKSALSSRHPPSCATVSWACASLQRSTHGPCLSSRLRRSTRSNGSPLDRRRTRLRTSPTSTSIASTPSAPKPPNCCRNYADQVGKAISVAAGAVGHRKCDTSPSLAHSLFDAISATNKFSIFTGDMIEAAVWLVTKECVQSQSFFKSLSDIRAEVSRQASRLSTRSWQRSSVKHPSSLLSLSDY